jgi:branched-chain amino acid transport system substrate-binding protein
MIEKDGAIMITGGSSSGVAIAVQSLCQEAGVIFMAGLTHSNDTTGKDKRANGFRHFFNTEMTGAALAPVLKNNYGTDRKAYHLTADYTWGWSQEGSIKKYTEAASAGRRSLPSAPRSAPVTSRSTSRRF